MPKTTTKDILKGHSKFLQFKSHAKIFVDVAEVTRPVGL
jgi:hypothetical protein